MPDFDDLCEPDEDDVSFVFERLDVAEGPDRYIASTIHRSDLARHFRALYAKHPVLVRRVDPRRWNHPDRLAEEADLRNRIHAARLAAGWPWHGQKPA